MALFRHVIEHSVDVAAPASVVFGVITDAHLWKDWSSMLEFHGGDLRSSGRIRLGLRTSTASYDFSPTVTVWRPDEAFEWLAITGFSGLFDGRHGFEISPLGPDRCRLRNVEVYSGLLTPFIVRTAMMRAAPAGFAAMNEEIQRRAEALAGAPR